MAKTLLLVCDHEGRALTWLEDEKRFVGTAYTGKVTVFTSAYRVRYRIGLMREGIANGLVTNIDPDRFKIKVLETV